MWNIQCLLWATALLLVDRCSLTVVLGVGHSEMTNWPGSDAPGRVYASHHVTSIGSVTDAYDRGKEAARLFVYIVQAIVCFCMRVWVGISMGVQGSAELQADFASFVPSACYSASFGSAEPVCTHRHSAIWKQ